MFQNNANVNPGLKVNQSINFSCTNMFFTAYVLCSLKLFKLRPEGRQTCANRKFHDTLQNSEIKILANPGLA